MFVASTNQNLQDVVFDDDVVLHSSPEEEQTFGKSQSQIEIGKDSQHFLSEVLIRELGAQLPQAPITLRLVGAEGAPVIFVMGGISANRFVAKEKDKSGWWSDLVSEAGAINLSNYRVASLDISPASLGKAIELTTFDYAKIIHHVLKDAGINELFAFIGASFGGLVGQAYAITYPEQLKCLGVLCAAHKPSAIGTGWRSIQRKILKLALESGRAEEGVAIARELAMTTYRTPEEFEDRFSVPGTIVPYLEHKGRQHAATTCPIKYLTLSAAIDRHCVAPEEISVPTLIVGSASDRLAPRKDLLEFQSRLGGVSWLEEIKSLYGHDAFLKDTEVLKPIISTFIQKVSSND